MPLPTSCDDKVKRRSGRAVALRPSEVPHAVHSVIHGDQCDRQSVEPQGSLLEEPSLIDTATLTEIRNPHSTSFASALLMIAVRTR
jgi:hypothetical protein